jgi:hypothetical protein
VDAPRPWDEADEKATARGRRKQGGDGAAVTTRKPREGGGCIGACIRDGWRGGGSVADRRDAGGSDAEVFGGRGESEFYATRRLGRNLKRADAMTTKESNVVGAMLACEKR